MSDPTVREILDEWEQAFAEIRERGYDKHGDELYDGKPFTYVYQKMCSHMSKLLHSHNGNGVPHHRKIANWCMVYEYYIRKCPEVDDRYKHARQSPVHPTEEANCQSDDP